MCYLSRPTQLVSLTFGTIPIFGGVTITRIVEEVSVPNMYIGSAPRKQNLMHSGNNFRRGKWRFSRISGGFTDRMNLAQDVVMTV